MKNQIISTELLLTVAEAAKRLHVSKSSVYGMANRKEIAHYKIGGKVLFAESDLLLFLASKRIETAEPLREESPPPKPLKYLSCD